MDSRDQQDERVEIAELAARLDADRWDAASLMTFEERAAAGVDLFDLMTASMRAGIRLQHPKADERTVEDLLVERLRSARRHEATM
ncbi:MAG: hypothetical protein L0Y42_15085 [Phycisphaerales bacterium]|nr:hypothetical protein [Phycisphaerales bacterium]